MLFAVIIENNTENEILLCKSSINGQMIWTLPHCVSDKDSSCAIEELIKKCKSDMGVSIETDSSMLYFNNDEYIVLCSDLVSHTYFSDKENKPFRWFKTDALDTLCLSDYFRAVFGTLLEKYYQLSQIRTSMINGIKDVSSQFNQYCFIDIQEQKDAINIFVRYPEKVFCPFGFRVDINFNESKQVQLIPSIFITRLICEGDKTDLYILFSNYMAIILKLFGGKNIYIDYLRLFDIAEINRASLIFQNTIKGFDISDLENLISLIKDNFIEFTMNLFVFGELIGSFNTELDESNISKQHFAYLCENKELYNGQARKEIQYYSDIERGISLLTLNNDEYRDDFLTSLTWEIVDGVEGKILCQQNSKEGYMSFNFVSSECWEKVNQVIQEMNIGKRAFICQSNALYMLEGKNIWIFEGNFNEYWVNEERKRLIDRQNKERTILHLNREFKWKYPIAFSRFEGLISDLCEKEHLVSNVRLMGKSNCPDGGRDLLIWKLVRGDNETFTTSLTIGQCKAYQRSVNKRDVTDIRDTIENYSASGFHLFVSSGLTAPLIDNLLNLRQCFESDWWTEREIFQRLRQHSDVADRYSDILEVVDIKPLK